MNILNITRSIVGTVILSVILTGGTLTDEFFEQFGTPDKNDIQYLGGTMQLENGDNGDKCLLLTGSVVLNRLYSSKWKGDTIKEIILAKGQYAPKTRNNFQTVKLKPRIQMLAKYLLIFGPICPSNVVYQGQRINGKGIKDSKTGKIIHVYDTIEVPGQKPELFCYE